MKMMFLTFNINAAGLLRHAIIITDPLKSACFMKSFPKSFLRYCVVF